MTNFYRLGNRDAEFENMKPKPTPKQIETLRLIRDGKVKNERHGYGAWRISGAHPTVVGHLIRSKAWAAWGPYAGDEQIAYLTAAGASVLADQEGPKP